MRQRARLSTMLLLALATQAGAATAAVRANSGGPSHRQGVSPPITVLAQLPPKSRAELALEAEDRAERQGADREAAHTDSWLVAIGIVQIVVFLGQLLVFGDQARKLRKTVLAAEQQSADMRESIRQSARSASALEVLGENMAKSAAAAAESVATMKERTALQMRAYLGVVIGAAVPQDRRAGLLFEVKPTLQNFGNTPASDVAYDAKAAILPAPLPQGLDLPMGQPPEAGAVMGPHEQRSMSAVVNGLVPDAEVAQIKLGQPRALYVWGVVKYKDIFGEQHETHFCHHMYWGDKQVLGHYVPGRNHAT